MYVYTIGVVHSADIKFGDLAARTDYRQTFSLADWPGLPLNTPTMSSQK